MIRIPVFYGWKRWAQSKWRWRAICPICHSDAMLTGVQVKRHVTLYGIPIARLLSDWVVECSECGLWEIGQRRWQQFRAEQRAFAPASREPPGAQEGSGAGSVQAFPLMSAPPSQLAGYEKGIAYKRYTPGISYKRYRSPRLDFEMDVPRGWHRHPDLEVELEGEKAIVDSFQAPTRKGFPPGIVVYCGSANGLSPSEVYAYRLNCLEGRGVLRAQYVAVGADQALLVQTTSISEFRQSQIELESWTLTIVLANTEWRLSLTAQPRDMDQYFPIFQLMWEGFSPD